MAMGMNIISIIYNEAHTGHKPKTSSPEDPERLTSIMDFLATEARVFDQNCVLIQEFEPAREQDALLVHEMRYIDFIKDFCKKGGGFYTEMLSKVEKNKFFELLQILLR